MRLRRTPYEMVWYLLDFCREPRRFTHIIQSCNFNTDSARRYLGLLIEKGMLAKREDSYETTGEGLRYLTLIEEVYEALFVPTRRLTSKNRRTL